MQFSELIGTEIHVLIPQFHPLQYQKLKLVGIETGGLWLQSNLLTNVVLEHFEIQTASPTLTFFLPYHEIAFALAATDENPGGVRS
jgi:hypothetical protein